VRLHGNKTNVGTHRGKIYIYIFIGYRVNTCTYINICLSRVHRPSICIGHGVSVTTGFPISRFGRLDGVFSSTSAYEIFVFGPSVFSLLPHEELLQRWESIFPQ
jgi:hypothetical protein